MTITFNLIGASSNGTSTVSPSYPSGITAGEFILAMRATWQTTSECDPQDEAGWTAGGELQGGTGSSVDAHTSIARTDYKTATGSESGSVTFDQSGTPGTTGGARGKILTYISDISGATWSVATATGTDNTHGANRSATASSSISLQPGDMLIALAAIDTDTSLASSSPALTASGITFGTTTNRTGSGTGSATGNDGSFELFDAVVSSGSGTAAPTLAFTTAVSQCGPVSFIRIREVAPVFTPHGFFSMF